MTAPAPLQEPASTLEDTTTTPDTSKSQEIPKPQETSKPQDTSKPIETIKQDVPSVIEATSKPTSKPKPFPSVTGGCLCNTIRYRLLTAPLFCYACHCSDCQKLTGSAFGLFLNIEVYNVAIISPVSPVYVVETKRPGLISRHVECPECKCELWSHGMLGPAIADVRVGTLDFPGLMEPDVHTFVGSKLAWIGLPAGAKQVQGQFDHKSMWPKSSLRRLEVCLKRMAEVATRKAEEGANGDGEKTPTAAVEFGEDDEAFEKRYKETERALQERLEKLRRKLEDEDEEKEGLDALTAKLDIKDEKEGEDGKEDAV
jgi:hypothetical protein